MKTIRYLVKLSVIASFAGIFANASKSLADPTLCEGVSEKQKPYCLAIKTIERSGNCESLSFSLHAKDLCLAIEELKTHGSCEFKDNSKLHSHFGDLRVSDHLEEDFVLMEPPAPVQKVCETLEVGMFRQNCSSLQGRDL